MPVFIDPPELPAGYKYKRFRTNARRSVKVNESAHGETLAEAVAAHLRGSVALACTAEPTDGTGEFPMECVYDWGNNRWGPWRTKRPAK